MKYSAIFITFLMAMVVNAESGELDRYYLEKFGELQTLRSSPKTTVTARATKCGMPFKKQFRSDWNKLESSTKSILGKQLAKPALAGESLYTSNGGHFTIHYATSGEDAPSLVTTPPHSTPDWVVTVGEIFEHVYSIMVSNFGYDAPTPLPYPIYLKQLAKPYPQDSYFGVTDSDILTGQSATSYITIDNNFSDKIYHPYGGLTGLQITAAHELHHAIQYTYNYYFDTWYAEATSSWIEDEIYDSINQLYDYSRDYLQNTSESLDTPSDGGYSRWLINRFFVENHGQTIIRSIWEKLRLTKANGNDIPMLPVIDSTMKDNQSSLGTEFESFAKRLYLKDWRSHTNEMDLLYSVPVSLYATFASYPVNQNTSSYATTSIPHYSIKYFKFYPSSSVTDLTVSVNSAQGIKTALFKKTASGIEEITANVSETTTRRSYTVKGFGILNPENSEVILTAVNVTGEDNDMLSISTDNSGNDTTPPPPQTNDSSKGGCFIATAAFGSYLHPKVAVLREFRDAHLLKTSCGKLIVATYYKLSPPLAAYIAKHEALRFIVRAVLTPIIFAVENFWISLAGFICCFGSITIMITQKRKKIAA